MAKKILLNEDEFVAFEGLPHLAIVLYIKAIRPFMDYQTGITGWKRGISYQSMGEELYIEHERGRHTSASGSPTRDSLRNAVQSLVNIGLLSKIPADKRLVFQLNKATVNNSVKTMTPTSAPQTTPTPATQAEPAPAQSFDAYQVDMNPTPQTPMNPTPQVSGKNLSITTTTNLKTDIPNQNGSGGGGGCDFNNLIFDKKLSDREIKAIKKALPTDNQEDAQALIDELVGAMATKEVKSKVSYFNALVKSFKAGEFIPMAGIEVLERRERVAIEKQEAIENRKQQVRYKENRSSETTTAGRAAMKALVNKGVVNA
jgi:hypothetical protein